MTNDKSEQTKYKQRLFIQLLLEGRREISEEEAEERKTLLRINNLVLPCCVVCIASDYSSVPVSEKDNMLLKCEKYIHTYFDRNNISCCTLTNSYNNVQAILHVKDGGINEELLIRLHEKIISDIGLDQFIGIGSVVCKYGEITVSASEATDMLAYKYQYAEKGVINISNIVRFQYNSNYGHNDMFDRVVGCFRDGNLPRMSTRLDELIREIRYRPGVSKTSIKRTMIELTVHLLTIASNANVDVDTILHGEDPYNWIVKQETTEAIKEWVMTLSSVLLKQIREQQKGRRNKIINNACDYINNHIGDNSLGLQSVCEHVGLSGPYFSRLFKEENGIGVNSYITAVRVQLAQNLLRHSRYKIEEIAVQIGFSRTNYFSNVFKREVGMTPGEYRKKFAVDL